MYRAAEFGKRRGWLWGLITLLWIAVLQQIFGSGLWMIFFGFLCSFISMTVSNFINDPGRNFLR